jgi:hypothetical protein
MQWMEALQLPKTKYLFHLRTTTVVANNYNNRLSEKTQRNHKRSYGNEQANGKGNVKGNPIRAVRIDPAEHSGILGPEYGKARVDQYFLIFRSDRFFNIIIRYQLDPFRVYLHSFYQVVYEFSFLVRGFPSFRQVHHKIIELFS